MCSVHLQVVPNGKLVFFPSHEQLNDAVSHWRMTGWLERSVVGLDRFCGMPVPWHRFCHDARGPPRARRNTLDLQISNVCICLYYDIFCTISVSIYGTYIYVYACFLKYSYMYTFI